MAALPKKELTLFDSTCLIVGIIIGAGIYETSPGVAGSVSYWWAVLLLWAIGGLLSLCGALGYAELAAAYPQAGGDYVYLNRAYGRWAGFLFGWVQLTIVRPGDIALMAFIFARYAHELFDPLFFKGTPWGTTGTLVYAGVSVLVLSFINILGVRKGKWTQNILTVTKVLGLVGILVVALAVPSETPIREYTATESSLPLSVAMIMILFTFGGWNEMAYVAAEMKNPQRNTLRTILVGTCAVTVLYLLINGAFLFSLGHGGLAGSGAVAVDTIKTYFSQYGQPIISALICISALGAINGLIFAGARISYALGSEHRLFHYLGHWNRRTETPVWSLGVQAVIALLLIIVLGSFKLTILFTAAAVYSFYLATNIAVIVLRKKEPQVVRPYKVTGYPLTPLLFAAVCGYLIYSAQAYAWHEYNKINAPWLSLIPLALLLLGLPIYWLTSAFKTPREKL